jgi:hypothetical protein
MHFHYDSAWLSYSARHLFHSYESLNVITCLWDICLSTFQHHPNHWSSNNVSRPLSGSEQEIKLVIFYKKTTTFNLIIRIWRPSSIIVDTGKNLTIGHVIENVWLFSGPWPQRTSTGGSPGGPHRLLVGLWRPYCRILVGFKKARLRKSDRCGSWCRYCRVV